MAEESSNPQDKFLNPINKYYGEFTPEHLAFNYNLQEFATQVSYICSLETNGKITPTESYQKIKKLWLKLKTSKTELLDQNKNKE